MYGFVDAAVVRVVTLPSGLIVAPWPDLTGTTSEHVAQWRCWLRQVWAQDVIAEAVEVASPVLARRVGEVCAGREQRVRQIRRAVVSVVRYLLRATSRATPFGLFAGVAPARFGPGLQLRYGEEHHAVARVDTEWLVGAIARLERCPELRRRLPVVLNNLAFVRDGRLVVGCQQQPTESGRTEPAEVSVRHTRAVETVVQAAQSPIRVADLADKLTAEFPETPGSVIEGLLAELVAQRILVASLRPPMTATDPLGHVVEELAAVGAGALPQVAGLVGDLREVHLGLSRHNRLSSPSERCDLRTSAAQRMAAIFTTERPVAVDLRVDCALVLPHAVAREAEAAAAALVRLSPYPVGLLAWHAWHARFVERYGVGALVPVSEILDADAGLGFPAGYRDARLKPPPVPGLSERDARLLVLAQNAAMDHSVEVVLDEEAIGNLAAGDVATAAVQPHASPEYPAGHGNFGMSHGIAGPLALLSLALRRGVVVDGHTDAIARICTWLDTWQQEHPCGPWWPGIITTAEVHKEHVPQSSLQRPSWCYGTPGLARAHQLAGLATGDTARQRTAETAMLGCLRDPAQLTRIVDSGLCHGMAGVFQTAWRIAADAHTPDIAAELPRLSARLLTQLRCAPEDTEFLDGDAGMALALHTAGTNTAPPTHWDACLLLT